MFKKLRSVIREYKYVTIAVVFLAVVMLNAVTRETSAPQTEKYAPAPQAKGAKGEFCTFSTSGYPWYYLKVYAVGHGPNQKLRRDTFVYSTRGMQPTEHVIVISGVTYSWNAGEKKGYKYANAPVPFREYFGLENFDLNCISSFIEDTNFLVPKDIKWTTPQGLRPG